MEMNASSDAIPGILGKCLQCAWFIAILQCGSESIYISYVQDSREKAKSERLIYRDKELLQDVVIAGSLRLCLNYLKVSNFKTFHILYSKGAV